MERREFVHPRHLLRSAGTLQAWIGQEGFRTPAAPVPGSSSATLLHFSRQAMATLFQVSLPFGQGNATIAAGDALDVIDQIEQQLSAYREDSNLCRLHAEARDKPVVLEERLFDLFYLSKLLHAETEGAFDIAAGELIKAWGFFRGPPRVPTPAEIQKALDASGSSHLELDSDRRTVRLLNPDVELNLGSIGKGYALDRAGETLRSRHHVHHSLLQGGRSSVLALGDAPGEDQGWNIGVKHPWKDGELLCTLRLKNQALGTSAATYKHLVHNGRKLGHILDPRTGWPAWGVASASAVAPTAALADALATAFFINGPAFVQSFCERHPEMGAVLLMEGSTEVLHFGTVERVA